MKLSYNWLKSYTQTKLSPEALAHKLTMAGLEVKGIEHTQAGDVVFESEVTPNRADCLSHIGVAREMSAIFDKPLKLPAVSKFKIPKKKCDITIVDKEGCRRYIGAVIQDIRVGAADDSIKAKISSVGIRSVNNIVDVTNFCLMETGQPLHTFDYDQLIGGKIIVRRAKDGEAITTIDGVERKLDSSILVIADEKRPVAIAGIMGGKDTEVTAGTKNILLESAYFDPIIIRRAARKLGITSDSSYRFERGVDINSVLFGAQRAVALINQYAGGTTVYSFSDIGFKKTIHQRPIVIKKNHIDSFLGIENPIGKYKTILTKLGFKISGGPNTLKVTAPSFRPDVTWDVDVMEEIARIIGYENIPVCVPQVKISTIPDDKNRLLGEHVASSLAGLGFNEAISYTMISQKDLEKTHLPSQSILRVQNPLSADQGIMRTSLLPGLLSVVAGNLNKGQKDLAFFELGKVYGVGEENEKRMLGIILTGKRAHDWRELKKTDADFYDLKGIVEELLKRFQIADAEFTPREETFLAKSQSAVIAIGAVNLGVMGRVSSDVLLKWDIKQRNVFFASMDISALEKELKGLKRYAPISGFPSINRDISLAVKDDVAFQQIRDVAYETGGETLNTVKFLEQYKGDKIPAGYRGITVSLVYQSQERTLREDEINELFNRFAAVVTEKFGAIKR